MSGAVSRGMRRPAGGAAVEETEYEAVAKTEEEVVLVTLRPRPDSAPVLRSYFPFSPCGLSYCSSLRATQAGDQAAAYCAALLGEIFYVGG